jgi:tyrosinase
VARTGLKRQFNTAAAMPTPPSLSMATYDTSPWNETSSGSFRNTLEARHNTVHNNIRGDMLMTTSPNDPAFWFHHRYIQLLWERWQANGHAGQAGYKPQSGGPSGHNYPDVLRSEWTPGVTIASLV